MYDRFGRSIEELNVVVKNADKKFDAKKGSLLRNCYDWELKSIEDMISYIEGLDFVDETDFEYAESLWDEGQYCEYGLIELKKLLVLRRNIVQNEISLRRSQKKGE